MKKREIVKIEGALEAYASRLLRDIDGVTIVAREKRPRNSDATVRFAGVSRPVDIEVKKYLNAATAWQLVRDAESRPSGNYLLVVADQITTDAKEILQRHDVGVVDSAGNAHLELPGLLLHIETARRPQAPPVPTRLSGKAALAAQVMLLHPERDWQIHDLAREANVSDGLVHRVLARLEAEGLVTTQGAGPGRVRRLEDRTALLDLWAEENRDRRVERTMTYCLSRTPEDLVRTAARRLDKAHIRYAVTGPAAAMTLAPFASAIPVVDVWIDAGVSPHEFATALDAEVVESGANLVLSQVPGDAPLAFRREHKEAWVVDPIRLYFDLRKSPRRGEEQAGRLRQEVIGF